MENEKIKVAQIMGKWLGGGVESVIMNYYKNIDRDKIQFDFFFDEDSKNIPQKEIEALGGKVIIVPPYQHIFRYNKKLKQIFKMERYDIVHSNINTLSVFPLRIAKKNNIPIRIAHSHSTTNKRELKKNLLKQILRKFSKVYANYYFSCSEIAGRWMFGDKTFQKNEVILINNAIEIEKFKYNEEIRKQLREELGIKQNDFIIGNIGRIVSTKNQLFLLDVLEKVREQLKNAKLIIIGSGNMEKELKNKIINKKLENNVIMVGQKKDIERYYQIMDIFALPSLYEGLGMVLIEAQAAGLPCIASKYVPNVAKVINEFEFLSIDDKEKDIKKWSEAILKFRNNIERKDYSEAIEKCGYNIKKEAVKLENIYIELISKKKGGEIYGTKI